MKFSKRHKIRHISHFDFRDLIEIIFGIFVGLLFFLGGSELWNIGAILTDTSVIVIVAINLMILYGLSKLIAGKIHKSSILIESVRHPLERSILVYLIGLIISGITFFWLNSTGLLTSFIVTSVSGVVPLFFRIAIFANLLATLIAITVDLSIVE